jgi:hypothetical protein
MPAWPNLGDEQVAAVVNHIVAGFEGVPPPDDFDADPAAEVAAQRGRGLTGADVHALRAPGRGAAPSRPPAPSPPPPRRARRGAAEPPPRTRQTATADVLAEPARPIRPSTATPPPRSTRPTARPATSRPAPASPACSRPWRATPPTLYAAEGGRDYLIDVMLYGLQGPIA